MKKSYIIYLLSLFLYSCGGAGEKKEEQPLAQQKPETDLVVALGRVEPADRLIPVGIEQGGVIEQVMIRQGDTVKKGQTILVLNRDLAQARLSQSAASLQSAKAMVAEAESRLTLSTVKKEKAQILFDRSTKMLQSNAVTRQENDNLRADLQAAIEEEKTNRAALATAISKVKEAEASVAFHEAELERMELKSPADGLILDFDLRPGQSVAAGGSLFELAPSGRLSVLCEADELFASRLKLGQKAIVRTQGLQDTLAMGVVTEAAPFLKKKSIFSEDSQNMEDRRVREIRILLNEGADLLLNARVEVLVQIQ